MVWGACRQGSPHQPSRRRGATSISSCYKAGKVLESARAMTELG